MGVKEESAFETRTDKIEEDLSLGPDCPRARTKCQLPWGSEGPKILI